MKALRDIEREQRENRRQIDRLSLRLATGATGRNVGATEAALDRRLARDRELIAKAAEAEAREEGATQ